MGISWRLFPRDWAGSLMVVVPTLPRNVNNFNLAELWAENGHTIP